MWPPAWPEARAPPRGPAYAMGLPDPARLPSMALPPGPPRAPGASPRSGVSDPTLIDSLLALSPEERLRLNDRMARTILELRHGFAAAEPDHASRPAGGERD